MGRFHQFANKVHVQLVRTRVAKALTGISIRQQISVFLISAGVTLILLTLGTYGWMRYEQSHLMSAMTVEPQGSSKGADSPANATLLSIPKIDLSAVIVDGTTRKSLLLAPGHMENTPDPGMLGNSVIAAHRDTFFRRLVELERGDQILLTRGRHQLHFVVTKKFIVSPQDLSVTKPSAGTRLTLVTCYPTYYIGPAPKRLIVVADIQEPVSAQAPLQASTALSRLR